MVSVAWGILLPHWSVLNTLCNLMDALTDTICHNTYTF